MRLAGIDHAIGRIDKRDRTFRAAQPGADAARARAAGTARRSIRHRVMAADSRSARVSRAFFTVVTIARAGAFHTVSADADASRAGRAIGDGFKRVAVSCRAGGVTGSGVALIAAAGAIDRLTDALLAHAGIVDRAGIAVIARILASSAASGQADGQVLP